MGIQHYEIQKRIAELEGQIAGANAELSKLKQVPCPDCDGKCGRNEIIDKGAATEMANWITCEPCNGTGKACGTSGYLTFLE